MSRPKLSPRVLRDSATHPSRRQRRSAEIRERLFRAALNLFSQKGFGETTVEDITEAADVCKGTFLIWSLYGDATLHSRIETAFKVLWTGLTPRGNSATALAVPLFTSGD